MGGAKLIIIIGIIGRMQDWVNPTRRSITPGQPEVAARHDRKACRHL